MSAVELDTQKLEAFAARIRCVVEKNTELVEKLGGLKIPLPERTAMRGVSEDNATALSDCAAYLTDTAEYYKQTEKDITTALKTGKYVLTAEIPLPVPQQPNVSDKTGLEKFIEGNKDALTELYNMVRDGKFTAAAFLDWLYRNFTSDPEILRKIFGEDVVTEENSLIKLVEKLFELFNGAFNLVGDADGLLKTVSDSKLDLPEGFEKVSIVVSAVDAYLAQYTLCVGIAALIVGSYQEDDKLIMAGADYIDDSLSSIADLVVALAAPTGPYGWAIGLCVDATINKYTNLIDGIVQKDSPQEMLWRLNVAPWLETLLDLTAGNFVCQQFVENKIENPIQAVLDVVVEDLGIDVDQNVVLDAMRNTDNWLEAIYKNAVDYWDNPPWLR